MANADDQNERESFNDQSTTDDQRNEDEDDSSSQVENEETIHERMHRDRRHSRHLEHHKHHNRHYHHHKNEQLKYGPVLKSNEIQVLYTSPETPSSSSLDRYLKDDQAKQVTPKLKQSPIALMSTNPAYEVQSRPLTLEYPATVDNLRLNNTGFSWEVKFPYQIGMTTALSGAHFAQTQRFRLDQFHCHWGDSEGTGSEHTVDNRYYSAELHFVHYNMEKYHTMSKAARHPDGLVVLGVFLDAQQDYHNHAELEKIASALKAVQLKGEHSIIKQALRVENLLPVNRSYWSYQGSLTTPPYLESVTWFVLKHPIKCSTSQIERFRKLRSSIRHDDDQVYIRSNFRKTQPLNGRTIFTHDEPSGLGGGGGSNSGSGSGQGLHMSHSNSSHRQSYGSPGANSTSRHNSQTRNY